MQVKDLKMEELPYSQIIADIVMLNVIRQLIFIMTLPLQMG